jgi:hypothetical protein
LSVKNRPVRPQNERSDPFLKQERKHLLTDPVFLIGNGKSRKDFDLERLREKGTIIGCNALYRDFDPDLLVLIDAKMLTEINESKYCEDHHCIIPNNRSVVIKSAMNWKTERFNTSGCFAMKMISQLMKPGKCYMLGMDGFPGNMYDKTKNYQVNTLQNFDGVTTYYLKALESSERTVFINVNHKDAWPKAAHETDKYKYITYKEFEETVMAP